MSRTPETRAHVRSTRGRGHAITPAEHAQIIAALGTGASSRAVAVATGRSDRGIHALATRDAAAVIAARQAWQDHYLAALGTVIDRAIAYLAEPHRWEKLSAYQLAGMVGLLGSRHDEVLAARMSAAKTAAPVLTLEEIRDARGTVVRRIARLEAQLAPASGGAAAQNGVVTPSVATEEGEKS